MSRGTTGRLTASDTRIRSKPPSSPLGGFVAFPASPGGVRASRGCLGGLVEESRPRRSAKRLRDSRACARALVRARPEAEAATLKV